MAAWLLGEIEVEALCPMPYSTTHFRGIDDFFGQPVRRGVSKSEFWDLRVKALAGCAKALRYGRGDVQNPGDFCRTVH